VTRLLRTCVTAWALMHCLSTYVCGQQAKVSKSEAINCLLRAEITRHYEIEPRINPFYLRGDFDGDGKPDYAFLVKDTSGRQGILVCGSRLKKISILGAGNKVQYGGAAVESVVFDLWQLYDRRPVEQGVGEGKPPRLVGDAILVEKEESASGIYYWDGKKFRWYQQGD
jgi:hypothetical protein